MDEYKIKKIEFHTDKYIKITYAAITIIGCDNELSIYFDLKEFENKTLKDLVNEK